MRKPFKYQNKNSRLERWVSLVTLPAAITLPAVHLLSYKEYPLFRLESILLLLTPMAIGTILIIVLRNQHFFLRIATFIAIVMVANILEIPRELIEFMPFPTGLKVLLTLILIVALPGLIIFRLKEKGMAIMGSACLAMLISMTISGRPLTPAIVISGDVQNVNMKLPPLVHIILDEHTSLAEIPQDLADEIKDKLTDFRLYPDAFSPFAYTPFALAMTLNPSQTVDAAFPLRYEKGWHLLRNEWFAYLGSLGYAISVHQPSFINYCSQPVLADRCYSYNPFSLNYLDGMDMPVIHKFIYLYQRILPKSWLPELARELWPAAANMAVNDVVGLMQRGARGKAFFIHLTTPHHPSMYHADCSLKSATNWIPPRLPASLPPDLLAEPYHEQMRCSWRQLERLLQTLKANNDFDDARIVIHGDHGRRFTSHGIVSAATAASSLDPVDLFATLLAIKSPGLDPGMESGRISITHVVAALMDVCNTTQPETMGYALAIDSKLISEHPKPTLVPVPIAKIESAKLTCPL